jgi:myo-inositol-1(or 4)-monophosphatase
VATAEDDERHLQAAVCAADHAGDIIRRWFRAPLTAERKSDKSPVTEADRGAERAMRAVLAEACPGYGLLGEEFGLENPGAAYRWVLDPIDGTRAFITGRPTFGTLIALVRDGVPILGLIDQPVTGERWIGIRGQKTRFSGRFGGGVGVRPCPGLDEAELSCTSPELLGGQAPRWQALAGAVARVTWGGDCYAYGLLALGHIDIIAECDLKIWDWAALLPVVEGAGGAMTDWEGNPLHPACNGQVLATGDARLVQPAVAKLRGSAGAAG